MRFNPGFGVLAGLLAAQAASAETIVVRRDAVVPVVLEDTISVKESRRGDRFTARVERNPDLPRGTSLEGRVVDLRAARGKDPAFVDLEFEAIVLPDGQRVDIRAVPVSLDSRSLSRDRDGRIRANRTKTDEYVVGGVVGGLVLGSLVKKPFEGAFAGAIVGILMAEGNKNRGEVVIRRGTRLGALFERDVRFETFDRFDRDDPWRDGDRRDDEWRRDPVRRDDDWGRDEDRWEPVRERGREVEIRYNERTLRFGNGDAPYWVGDTVMVPLERAAGQLGLDVTVLDGRTILVEDEDSVLKLEQDSRDYRLNGKRGTLSRIVVSRDGVVYVPLEALAETKDGIVTVNGTRIGNSA